MDLLTSFIANWQKKQFVTTRQPVLLAVSGGVDSMVMAALFLQVKIPFAVAHCNFQLRGADADGDEAHVQQWAAQHNIPCYTTRFDTAAKAKEWKKSIQETARDLRYGWLEGVRKEHGYHSLATAHHANDNAETLLINLFKGTGISGLHGIPERNGHIIRPLLFATREQIAEYAKTHGIAYREDASNASDKYLRNAVRLNIMPVVAQHFPGVTEQLSDSIQRFAQAGQLYRKEVDRQLRRLKDQRGSDIYIPVLKLQKTEAVETIAYELFREYGFTAAQTAQLLALADAESGRFVASPSHKVIKDRNFLIITSAATEETDLVTIDAIPATVTTANGSFKFTQESITDNIPSAANIACLDVAKLNLPLTLRRWRTGDYFYPLGMGMKKKKLSRFFIDQKLPLHEKEKVWVLESNKRIVWVAGMRLDERFKITPATKEILKVELRVQ